MFPGPSSFCNQKNIQNKPIRWFSAEHLVQIQGATAILDQPAEKKQKQKKHRWEKRTKVEGLGFRL